MSTAKKPTTKSGAGKKGVAKPAATHPTYFEMIKNCIVDHPEDARTGVSRPQIKKYITKKYKIEFGPSQTSQLNRSLAHAHDKGTLVFKKGLSGRVSLPRGEASAAKENKPASKTASKSAKPAAAKSKATTAAKDKPTKAPAKASSKAATKKTPAAKAAAGKKTAAKKAQAKKVAAGASKAKATSKAKSAPKASAKKTAAK